MSARRFQELDWRPTAMGALVLRRRWEPVTGRDVYEVKLGDDFLMSSLFTAAEEELARLGLAAVDRSGLAVVVGGLGLGFTARAALDDERVQRLVVVEALEPVVEWHRDGLLDLGRPLLRDPRTEVVVADFFARAAAGTGFGDVAGPPYDVVLLDVDHAPDQVLAPHHAALYTADGVSAVADVLAPDGVLAVWADTGPDERFLDALRAAFGHARADEVVFDNRLTGGTSRNVVYVASAPRRPVQPGRAGAR